VETVATVETIETVHPYAYRVGDKAVEENADTQPRGA